VTERYELLIKPSAQRALAETLSPSTAFAAWEFINGALRESPRRVGKPLLGPLRGDWSARRGYLRVRYRIDEAKKLVTVVDIAHRSDAYHSHRAT
jgi:mRNA-degrading endonuclease RelE of RelBE toxin-antitoxin system